MEEIVVRVPGSKSITQRSLVCAALAEGTSILKGPLKSEDPLLLKDALEKLGVRTEEDGNSWMVHGTGGRLAAQHGITSIFMGNNGTGIRFLTAVACLASGNSPLEITGTVRMTQRPIEPLLDALRMWGALINSKDHTGCPPVLLQPKGYLKGGKTTVDASKSSQYLSALLLVAPYTQMPTEIALKGPLASSPYLHITLEVMRAFGIEVSCDERLTHFKVHPGRYSPTEYTIEGDASSASYFYAAAAITGMTVTVKNIPKDSMQGDAQFVQLLEAMGCKVWHRDSGTTVQGPPPGGLRAIQVSMQKMPDMVPTLAAIAPFASGKTVITGCPHLRIKETDRIAAMAAELTRIGARVEELPDGLIIHGAQDLRPAYIRTYDDHRIAMSFAVVGLKVRGMEIEDPHCVKKSFPHFWAVWEEAFGRSHAV